MEEREPIRGEEEEEAEEEEAEEEEDAAFRKAKREPLEGKLTGTSESSKGVLLSSRLCTSSSSLLESLSVSSGRDAYAGSKLSKISLAFFWIDLWGEVSSERRIEFLPIDV